MLICRKSQYCWLCQSDSPARRRGDGTRAGIKFEGQRPRDQAFSISAVDFDIPVFDRILRRLTRESEASGCKLIAFLVVLVSPNLSTPNRTGMLPSGHRHIVNPLEDVVVGDVRHGAGVAEGCVACDPDRWDSIGNRCRRCKALNPSQFSNC
jgi:hypothetical protein